jgi:predicted SAM-dependent methyltransferase
MKNLNVGCGSTFHPTWVNVDLASYYSEVQTCDIRKGLPYPDNTFDACYSSHVLEHLTRTEASNLLNECVRVLKPGGVIRVVVPDLEKIVQLYLHILNQVKSGLKELEPNYDWIMLELFDQVVRSVAGGEMACYLKDPKIKNKEFVKSRLGLIAEDFWAEDISEKQKSNLGSIIYKSPSWFINKFRIKLAKYMVSLTAGREARDAFEEGLFRNSGEVHRWMYDSFSLRRALECLGLVEIYTCRAEESRIPEFNNYNLDVENGAVRIPQSLFVEGIKPLQKEPSVPSRI